MNLAEIFKTLEEAERRRYIQRLVNITHQVMGLKIRDLSRPVFGTGTQLRKDATVEEIIAELERRKTAKDNMKYCG